MQRWRWTMVGSQHDCSNCFATQVMGSSWYPQPVSICKCIVGSQRWNGSDCRVTSRILSDARHSRYQLDDLDGWFMLISSQFYHCGLAFCHILPQICVQVLITFQTGAFSHLRLMQASQGFGMLARTGGSPQHWHTERRAPNYILYDLVRGLVEDW